MTAEKIESPFLTQQEKADLEATIAQAEQLTSGEIRVHIEYSCKGYVLDRAAEVFAELNMQATKERNGVLIYIAQKEHLFSIIGDIGINSKVPTNFWDQVKVVMQQRFRSGKFLDGLREGVKLAAQQLSQHFPPKENDVNELSNAVSFGPGPVSQ